MAKPGPKPRTALVGWLSQMKPADAAQAIIDRAKDMGRDALVLHIDRASTRLTLRADRDAPLPPNHGVLGVRFDSDPDWLADELRDELALCGHGERDRATRVPAARADAKRVYSPMLKARVLEMVESGIPVRTVADLEGVPYKRAHCWVKEARQ